jgi:aminoglycoside phosphotransferase
LLNDYTIRVLKHNFSLILPMVLITVAGAPWILQLFGPDYAVQGAPLLRLLAISSIPQVIISLHISMARVQRHIKTLIITQAAIAVLVLGLTVIFLKPLGITGIGWAWLIAQSLVAGIILITHLHLILVSHVNLYTPLHMLHRSRSLLHQAQDRRQAEQVNLHLPEMLPSMVNGALPHNWRSQHVLGTVNDLTLVAIGPAGGPATHLVKLAKSDQAAVCLANQKNAIRLLRCDERLAEWRHFIPDILGDGHLAGRYYLVEQIIPGQNGRVLLNQKNGPEKLISVAVGAIMQLHQRTLVERQVNPTDLNVWIDQRLAALQSLTIPSVQAAVYGAQLDRLSVQLHQALEGRSLPLSCIHGDFTPDNILIDPIQGEITGIVDWDMAAGQEHPMIDLVHLLLSTRLLLDKRELGDIIHPLLAGQKTWNNSESNILERAQCQLPGARVEMRTLLLLTWLRHVTSNLAKSPRYRTNWLWLTKNVHAVIRSL